jgi:Uma2 family endonuclease
MTPNKSPEEMHERYEQEAEEYLQSLPLEHFMEATPQATQRKITLESLDLVTAARPEVHVFNELLLQYPRPGMRRQGKVVPDNMVVIHDGPIQAALSYTIKEQPAGPFWTLEYVSKSSRRKDYDDNMDKYERELRVPYYLLFQPDVQELTLYRHNGKKYVSVKPNSRGRYAIKELELEVALLDEWVRFWFRGELLPLPAQLLRERNEARRELTAERRARLAVEEENARLRAEMEQMKRQRNHE